MPTDSPLSKEHPIRAAWAAYVSTEEFAILERWAGSPQHLRGALWATFLHGIEVAGTFVSAKDAEVRAIEKDFPAAFGPSPNPDAHASYAERNACAAFLEGQRYMTLEPGRMYTAEEAWKLVRSSVRSLAVMIRSGHHAHSPSPAPAEDYHVKAARLARELADHLAVRPA